MFHYFNGLLFDKNEHQTFFLLCFTCLFIFFLNTGCTGSVNGDEVTLMKVNHLY